MSRIFVPGRPTSGDGSQRFYPADALFPGTVWSVQPAHPGKSPAGVAFGLSAAPTNGQTIGNVAWQQLATLMGYNAGQESLCHGTFVIGSAAAANQIKLELTPKGGLHILMSQAQGTINTYAYFAAPQAVADYVCQAAQIYSATESAAKHRFALVMWVKRTRTYRTDSGLQGNAAQHFRVSKSDNSVVHGSMTGAGFVGVPYAENNTPPTTSNCWQVGVNAPVGVDPSVGIGVPTLRAVTIQGWSAAPPAAGAGIVYAGANCRPQAAYTLACASEVIYRVDLVDLWAGGLEWDYPGPALASYVNRASIGFARYADTERFILDQRNAIEFAFGPEGEFYGDTIPTDPATFA